MDERCEPQATQQQQQIPVSTSAERMRLSANPFQIGKNPLAKEKSTKADNTYRIHRLVLLSPVVSTPVGSSPSNMNFPLKTMAEVNSNTRAQMIMAE
jgi:hypothetical protein